MAIAIATVGSACVLGPKVRGDIAIIEGGDAAIWSIDRVRLPQQSYGPFELQPGGHTFDVTATAMQFQVMRTVHYRSGLRTVCVKARAGHRYRIRTKVQDNQLQLFVVDAATGEPPKTPCGPDEDDD